MKIKRFHQFVRLEKGPVNTAIINLLNGHIYQVEKCKDCELKYTCFDCRELAYRATGNLFSTNPNCKYNPNKGNWS